MIGTTGGNGDGLKRLLSHRLLTSDDYVDRGQTTVITWMDDVYAMWASTETFANIHEQTHLELNEFEHCDNCSHDQCRGSNFTVLIVTAASGSIVFHAQRVKIYPLLCSRPTGFRAETKYIRAGNTRPSGIQPVIRTAGTTIALFYAPLSTTNIYYWLLARWPVSSIYTDNRPDPVPPALAYVYIHRI
jgi:hypothetical protein